MMKYITYKVIYVFRLSEV